MNDDRKTAQMLVKSLCEFIDAGMSHANADLDKLYLLTALAMHIEKRQKEIGGDSVCQPLKQQPQFKDKKRMKKAISKN